MREGLRQLGVRIIEVARTIDSLTSELLADLRRFDDEKGWRASGEISCVHWLMTHLGWDRVTARERMRVARRLAHLPETEAAYRAGELSYSKVRALVRVGTPATEVMLLERARRGTAAQLERICGRSRDRRATRNGSDPPRRLRVRRRSLDDGTVRIDAVFSAADAAVVWEALRVAADSAESPTTDLVVALARKFLASHRAETRRKRTSRAATRVGIASPRARLPARHAAPGSTKGQTVAANGTARSSTRSPSEGKAAATRRARRPGIQGRALNHAANPGPRQEARSPVAARLRGRPSGNGTRRRPRRGHSRPDRRRPAGEG
jgi:hypothetical protein